MIIKAKNIICNKMVEVELVDNMYSDTCVEVKILEGDFIGKMAIVNREDIFQELEIETHIEKREFTKKYKYHNIQNIEITVYNDCDGCYLVALANAYNPYGDYEDIVLSSTHNFVTSEKNISMLLKEAKKLNTKYKKWNYEIVFNSEVVEV